MENLVVREYLGNNIDFKMVKGHVYANANKMAEAFGGRVKLDNWKRSENTKRYIEALKKALRENHDTELIIVKQGGKATEQGTWIHEKLILNFARYLNIEFELWCDEQIATLLRDGKVEIKQKPLTPAEFLLQQAQLMVEMENRVTEVEKDVKRLEHNQRRTITSSHLTIIAYANMKGISSKYYNSSVMGRKATKICKAEGLLIGKIVDSKYGLVNTYPEDVLDRIFCE